MRRICRPALLFALTVACTTPATPSDAGTPLDAARADAREADGGLALPAFETIEERMVTELDVPRRVELVRATRLDGAHTYLIYVHAATTPAPLVIANQPYAGIDWTGEEVDARWAAAGNGLRADVDAPAYDGDDVTSYGAVSVQAAVDDCIPWIANGLACVEIYARFYAGGTLVDDALDAATAYDFALARSGEIDLTRIAAWGGSWGGMMTLEGAARAPAAARPRTIVALAPPSDFVDLAAWTDRDLPSVYPRPADVEAFFSPYWRRSAPDLGRSPIADERSRLFRPEGLCAALPSDTWVVHDEWDTLIPFRQSEALVALCPDRVHGLWWRRQTPTDFADIGLDHGAFGREPTFPTAYTFAIAHIVDALVPATAPTWLAIAHEPALESYLGTVHDEQLAGGDATYALPLLRLLAGTRAQMFDPTDATIIAGGDVVARAVNAVWGTSFDAAGVRAQLATGLPPA